MINEKIRAYLEEVSPDSLVFDNPSFDNSIIGLSTDGNVIYDLSKMVSEMAEEDNMSEEEEALEFIEYNTLRAIPYFNDGIRSVVMDCDAGIEDILNDNT